MAKSRSPYNLIFFGTSNFAYPLLDWLLGHKLTPSLVITQPDKPTGRKQTLTPSIIKQLAVKNGLNLQQPDDLNDAGFKKTISDLAPDLGIVLAYGKFIPAWLWRGLPLGVINIHPSLLPKYRGPSPIQSAIINGDNKTGNSLMLIDSGMDTGPLLGQQEISVAADDTTPTLESKLAIKATELMDKYLTAYLTGKLKLTPQPAAGTITKIIDRSDGKVDWREPAEVIERKYRAYLTWPGLWTTWQEKPLKLIDISLHQVTYADPGKVSYIDDRLIVSCAEGAIQLNKLQLAGKRIVTSAEILNGYPQLAGATLQ
ncbi:MAG: methionyl-tRNA formyltransferase [Patescibacteria group bacterium]